MYCCTTSILAAAESSLRSGQSQHFSVGRCPALTHVGRFTNKGSGLSFRKLEKFLQVGFVDSRTHSARVCTVWKVFRMRFMWCARQCLRQIRLCLERIDLAIGRVS